MTYKILGEVKMHFQGKILEFQIYFRCSEYIFCECKNNPSARGFFTKNYINENAAL